VKNDQRKFGLTRLFIDNQGFIELPKHEFEAIVIARNGLFGVLELEEKLDLVLENFLELEQELLNIALRQSVSIFPVWNAGMVDRQRVNRRLANLLTTARLYFDQKSRELANIYGRKSQVWINFRAFRDEHLNANLGCRVMSELRDYIQHRSLPVHTLTYHSGWEEHKNRSFLVYMTIPKVNVRLLEADRDFERSVIEELKQLGELVDIRPLVREYVESLALLHQQLRGLTDSDEKNWFALLEKSMFQYAKTFGENLTGLAAVELDQDGDIIRELDIFKDPIERLKFLRTKNASFQKFSLRYVSGRNTP